MVQPAPGGSENVLSQLHLLSAESRHYFSGCKCPKTAVLNIYVVRVYT